MSADFMRYHLGGPVQVVERCPKTDRVLETGIGALPFEEQTRRYVLEAQLRADLPSEGSVCGQTGRPYEVSNVSAGLGEIANMTKTAQTARFLEELPDDLKAQRRADFEKLRDTPTAGRA